MIWIATMKDGSVIRQFDLAKEISSASLDKENIEKFRITETSGDTAVQFSSDSGVIKFSNLDYGKVMNLEGGEELKFVFDKKTETFKLDKESLGFFNEIYLPDEKDYFFIEFDQTGIFNIYKQIFYLGFVTQKGELIPFINQPPYNDFKFIVTKNEDIYHSNNVPLKKTAYVTSYSIELNKVHESDIANFKISYQLIFDILKGCILLDCIISADRKIEGSLFMQFGNTKKADPFNFSFGEKKQIRRILTLI